MDKLKGFRVENPAIELSSLQKTLLKTQITARKDNTKTHRNSLDPLLYMQGISLVDSAASSLPSMQFRGAVCLSVPVEGEFL